MKFLHTMIRVTDLERSIAFYKDALQLEVSKTKDYPEDQFTLVYLKDDTGYEVEFTFNYGDNTYEHGNHYGHMAFETGDLKKSFEYHKKMNCISTEIQSLSDGSTSYYFIKDPDGFAIEIIGK